MESKMKSFLETVQSTIGYSLTVTFKTGPYSDLHPKKVHELFKKTFLAYCTKKKLQCYMMPEIGKNGRYHLHGIITTKEVDPENQIRLFKNFVSRKYGFSQMQRIYSWYTKYLVENIRPYCKGRCYYTDFPAVWIYIHKDVDRFTFMKSINSIEGV